VEKEELRKITEIWQKETDEWVLRAVTQNIDEYPPEVRTIIRDEAVKRDLITYEVNQEDTDKHQENIVIKTKGEDILNEATKISPRVVSVKLMKTIFILISIALVVLIVGLILGVPEGILAAVGGCAAYMAIRKIWPSEEERQKSKEEKRQVLKYAKDHPEQVDEMIKEIFDEHCEKGFFREVDKKKIDPLKK
jgi:hypothetical protein